MFLFRRENVKIPAFYLMSYRGKDPNYNLYVRNDKKEVFYSMGGLTGMVMEPGIRYRQLVMFPDRPQEMPIELELEPGRYYADMEIDSNRLIIFYFREAVTPAVEQTINFEVK